MRAIMRNRLHLIPEAFNDRKLIDEFKAAATVANPAYEENERFGRSQWKKDKGRWVETPEKLLFWQEEKEGISFPAGMLGDYVKHRQYYKAQFPDFEEERLWLPVVHFPETEAQPREYQAEALAAVEDENEGLQMGVIQMPTGAGKTFVGCALVRRIGQPTLVIVHTKELLDQWREAGIKFLGLDKKEIGMIGGGKKTIGSRLTVAIINSLQKMLTPETASRFGAVLVDECHRTPSTSFSKAVDYFPAAYKYGFSATPYRRDGLTCLIDFFLGDTLYRVAPAQLQAQGYILKPKIKAILTDFNFKDLFVCPRCDRSFRLFRAIPCPLCGGELDKISNYTDLMQALANDVRRNKVIAFKLRQVLEQATPGELLVVLSDRKDHLEAIAEEASIAQSAMLTGDLAKKKREAIVSGLRSGAYRVIYTTTQLVGEGFDCKEISRLFLATPIKFKGRVLQVIGRALRPNGSNKQPIIYDFVDERVPTLMRSWNSRRKAYKEVGAA